MEIINIDKPNSLNTEAENVSCETEANANQNCIDQEDGSTAATTNAVDTEIQSIEESHDVGGADSIDKVEKGNEENNDFSNDTTSNECVSVQSDDSESKSELEQVLDGEWKKMIVYDQFTRTRNTGKIIYKGEDAFPYVGNDLFFVADGLGGTGASTHTKFDKKNIARQQVHMWIVCQRRLSGICCNYGMAIKNF